MRKRYSYYQMKNLAEDPTMDYSRKTMLYVSGYLDSPNFLSSRVFETIYRKLGYNIWLLDMLKFMSMEYPLVARIVPTVGKHVGEMLYNLTLHNPKFDPKKLEVVGFSLGGQTMSFIAKSYKALSGTKISRLTALDPMGPCFRNLGPERRLDKEDADFVELIGTNIDGYGFPYPVGHVNFYVNGGEHQPNDIVFMPCDMSCSHVKAYTTWFSAVQNPNSFIAMQCDSVQQARDRECYDRKPMVTNVLGLDVDKTKHGIFYLAVNFYYPYYMGELGTKKEYEPNSSSLNKMNPKELFVL
ncbi:lipase member H-A-like [Aphomia sociella]